MTLSFRIFQGYVNIKLSGYNPQSLNPTCLLLLECKVDCIHHISDALMYSLNLNYKIEIHILETGKVHK